MSFNSDDPKKDSRKAFSIHFENYVGNELLKLNSAEYKNDLGQSYNISKFKYYVSNIRLKNSNGKEFISNEYFLLNEDDVESKQILLENVIEGEYTSISFTLGVDSLHNCSGIQEGTLDPLNGMFWAWNTGYIFLKLEGRSPESKISGNFFEYHIGGFKDPVNSIREITLDFTGSKIKIGEGDNAFIKIKADIEEILKNPNTIDFSILPSVTDLKNATLIADNYRDMFSILEVR